MTALYKRIIIVGICLILIAGIASAAVLSGGCSTNAGDPLEGAKVSATNTLIDLSGIKGRIDSEVRAKASEVASESGGPQAVVDNIVDSVAIEDWQATSLPPDAVETGTYDVVSDDMSAKVTTYEDPSVVTVEAYGQTITMEVPESAQSYVPFIKYLEYLPSE